MLIRTQRDLAQAKREQEKIGKQLSCSFCETPVSSPPALKIGYQFFHHSCALSIVYATLEDISGYSQEMVRPVQPAAPHMMEETFRAAAQHSPL